MKNKKEINWWKVAGIIFLIIDLIFIGVGLSDKKEKENIKYLHHNDFNISEEALQNLLSVFEGGDFVLITNLEYNKSVVVQKANIE